MLVQTQTKDRILEATAELFRRQGYTGTGMKQIVAAANAPFGSLYHHFPGGKEQLGEQVIRSSGEMYFRIVASIMSAAPDVVTGTRDAFAGAAALLEATDYADACPIATIALEVASTNEPLRIATADVFESWIAGGTKWFTNASVDEGTARALTISFIAALEGAFILCRATRTTEALDVVGAQITEQIRDAVATSKRNKRPRSVS